MSKDTILVITSIRYSYEGKELLVATAIFTYSALNLDSAIAVDKENQRINVKADIFPSLAKYPLPMIEVKTLVEKNGISVEK